MKHVLIISLFLHTFMVLPCYATDNKLYQEPIQKIFQKPNPRRRTHAQPPVRICWHRRESYYARYKAKTINFDPYTTSVIIPCYHKHAPSLYSLLRLYEQQTQLPDEVIISLSEYQLVNKEVMAQLSSEQWAFPVTIILSEQKKYAGDNRNTACEHASGTIFICQDADDIPHPQRVDIIHHFFKHYPVDHLFHQWVEVLPGDEASFIQYDTPENISFTYHQAFRELWWCGKFTNGNVALARHVFDTVRWSSEPRGQDTLFNAEVYKHFKQGIAIQAILLGYRMYLSSACVSDDRYLDNIDSAKSKRVTGKMYPAQFIFE